MTSINFNASATTALRTLQSTNSALETTQSRVATGLKIGEAKDNAAYWSISTTLKSDNKSLSTIKDALNLGAATVDVAYQGLNKAKDVLDEIKTKLTSATQAGVDRTAIQADISALQDQLRSIATSSNFSGENWLSVNSDVLGYDPEKTIVASFSRDAANTIAIGTIKVDTSKTALIDVASGGNGIVDKAVALKKADGTLLNYGGVAATGAEPAVQSLNATTGTPGIAAGGATQAIASLGSINRTGLHLNDRITFNIAVDGGTETAVTVDIDATALATDDGFIGAINTGLTNSGITTATAGRTGTAITLTSTAMGAGSSVVVSDVVPLDGDGVAIVQATATGGLSAVAAPGLGSATAATLPAITFGAGAIANGDTLNFKFQYGNEIYQAQEIAFTAAPADATAFKALIDAAIANAVSVSDGTAFAGTITSTVNAGNTTLTLETADKGADQKLAIAEVLAQVGGVGAHDATIDGGLAVAAPVNGTSTAAVYNNGAVFSLSTMAQGDRITFGATLSDGDGGNLTRDVSISTTGVTDEASFLVATQNALDIAFGAGAVQVGLLAGAGTNLTFTTQAKGENVAFSINNILAQDGDGATPSVAGLIAGSDTGTDLTTDVAAYTQTNAAFSGTMTFDDQDEVTFDLTVNNVATKITINKAAVDEALGTEDGVVSSAEDYARVINEALKVAEVDDSVVASAETGDFLRLSAVIPGAGSISVTNADASSGASTISVDTINLTSSTFTALTDTQKADVLSAYLSVVNNALTSVISAASSLGSVSSRIDLQNSFVDTLIDTIDKGVSNLVDADLSEESTKLQALQTKQSLGIQALSIANSSQQNILRLFQ